MRRATALAASIVGIALLGLVLVGNAEAQTSTPTPAPPGSITGTVTNGTAGITSVAGATMQLLAIDSAGAITSQDAPVTDGRFSFTPPASSTVTYVLRATYQGIDYLDEQPILLSPALPTDTRTITVYETTSDAPALSIDSTVVSVQGLDRAQGQLTLQREDQVINPGDRVYIGRDDHVSFRMPAPEGVVDILPVDSVDGESKLDGGTATSTQPLKPGINLIVTRYTVSYDPADAAYHARVTTPLPAAHMEFWVPIRFVEDVTPGPNAVRTQDRTLQDEKWHVVARTDAATEGEALTVTPEGLGGASAVNPLTQQPQAAIAGALALGALLAGVLLLSRVRISWGGGTDA